MKQTKVGDYDITRTLLALRLAFWFSVAASLYPLLDFPFRGTLQSIQPAVVLLGMAAGAFTIACISTKPVVFKAAYSSATKDELWILTTLGFVVFFTGISRFMEDSWSTGMMSIGSLCFIAVIYTRSKFDQLIVRNKFTQAVLDLAAANKVNNPGVAAPIGARLVDGHEHDRVVGELKIHKEHFDNVVKIKDKHIDDVTNAYVTSSEEHYRRVSKMAADYKVLSETTKQFIRNQERVIELLSEAVSVYGALSEGRVIFYDGEDRDVLVNTDKYIQIKGEDMRAILAGVAEDAVLVARHELLERLHQPFDNIRETFKAHGVDSSQALMAIDGAGKAILKFQQEVNDELSQRK